MLGQLVLVTRGLGMYNNSPGTELVKLSRPFEVFASILTGLNAT